MRHRQQSKFVLVCYLLHESYYFSGLGNAKLGTQCRMGILVCLYLSVFQRVINYLESLILRVDPTKYLHCLWAKWLLSFCQWCRLSLVAGLNHLNFLSSIPKNYYLSFFFRSKALT